MSETDLEVLVKEARIRAGVLDLLRPHGVDVTGKASDVFRLLADALEASIERERKIGEAVREVVRQKDRMFGDHGVSRVALWDAIDAARQALDSGADH